MRHVTAVVLAAARLGGSAQVRSDTPYRTREACEGSGGGYAADRTGQAGRE